MWKLEAGECINYVIDYCYRYRHLWHKYTKKFQKIVSLLLASLHSALIYTVTLICQIEGGYNKPRVVLQDKYNKREE